MEICVEEKQIRISAKRALRGNDEQSQQKSVNVPVCANDAYSIHARDEQRTQGWCVFGGGFLLSEKATAEKYNLSNREFEIVGRSGVGK